MTITPFRSVLLNVPNSAIALAEQCRENNERNTRDGRFIRAAGSGKGLQRGGKSRCGNLIDSGVAELIWAEISGIIQDICQNNLAKEFFGDIEK